MKTSYDVLQTLIRTEKGSSLEDQGKYFFKVAKTANKIQIKAAVEEIYGVQVDAVNTVSMPSKPKRMRSQSFGKTAAWKKAIVTLKEGQKIDQI